MAADQHKRCKILYYWDFSCFQEHLLLPTSQFVNRIQEGKKRQRSPPLVKKQKEREKGGQRMKAVQMIDLITRCKRRMCLNMAEKNFQRGVAKLNHVVSGNTVFIYFLVQLFISEDHLPVTTRGRDCDALLGHTCNRETLMNCAPVSERQTLGYFPSRREIFSRCKILSKLSL